MKYLLAGLGCYSIIAGIYFYEEHKTITSLLIGESMGILLLGVSILLFATEKRN